MKEQQKPQNSSSEYRDHLATVSESGKRIWVYPKQQKGKFYWRRTIVAVLLLVLFLAGPFIRIKGEPLLLFNILKKEFIVMGFPFTVQDTFLFAVFMLTGIVFILLFTVIYGRFFCGWLCPQTIFMEHVFRKIEYWVEGDANKSRRLDKQGWTNEKKKKKILKWAIFYLIAFIIANFFLMYIIGSDEVIKIITEPLGQHIGGFIAILIFSFIFFMVFANLRDQVCTTICPYGRLQGVFLDKNSITVSYDFERGEPRGKAKKKKKKADVALSDVGVTTASFVGEEVLGDCVDCDLCVKVCPTGIDIRNGTQLECINCTLCMDACDSIMQKVGRTQGLIRYASYNSIVNKKETKIFNVRTIAYSVVMVALLGFLGYLLTSRTSVKLFIQRTRGSVYMKVDEQHGKNFYTYQLINKTRKTIPVELKLLEVDGKLEFIGLQKFIVEPKGRVEGSVFLTLDKKDIHGHSTMVKVGVFVEGKQLEEVDINFVGPVK